jgi:hypothetical protein
MTSIDLNFGALSTRITTNSDNVAETMTSID